MQTPDIRNPRPAATGARAQNLNQHRHSTLFREIVSILAVGAMMATMFWSAVFGMVDSFTSGPVVEVVGSMAEVEHGHR